MIQTTLTTKPTEGYELLDSGLEEKLERFGDVVLRRPDPQALWPMGRGEEWQKAVGAFERDGKEGKWNGKELPKEWQVSFGGMQFLIKPTSFKHTGLFPEQLSNWEWSQQLIKNAGREVNVLNIFGYTGGATLAAAAAGAKVTHVDASKTAVAWARENAKLSGLEEAPIRWITEDALTYLKREVSRGSKYDAVIMDPPAFGHGPDGEVWKFEEHFLELLGLVEKLLSDQPLFILINGYAAGYSPLAFAYNLQSFTEKRGGEIEYGDLAIAESNSERVLPAGIFARWRV
jgi:23S rRNA (cytosine1962-C5)-methyltransferase